MRYVAGHRTEPSREVVHIDYADVLRQAVENERHRVLREVRKGIQSVKTTQEIRNSYRSENRNPNDVKRDVLAALDRIEAAP